MIEKYVRDILDVIGDQHQLFSAEKRIIDLCDRHIEAYWSVTSDNVIRAVHYIVHGID